LKSHFEGFVRKRREVDLHNLKELGGATRGKFYLRKPTVQITFLLVFNVVVQWSNQHFYLVGKFKEYLPVGCFVAVYKYWLEIKTSFKKTDCF
jgi:hypothetical protein